MAKRRIGSRLLLAAALTLVAAGAKAIAGNDTDAPSIEGNSDSAPVGKDSRGDGVREPTRNPPSHEGAPSSKGSLAPWDSSKDDDDDLKEQDREESPGDEDTLDDEDYGSLKAAPESGDDRDEDALDGSSDDAQQGDGVDGD